jgi:hypothetical protein
VVIYASGGVTIGARLARRHRDVPVTMSLSMSFAAERTPRPAAPDESAVEPEITEESAVTAESAANANSKADGSAAPDVSTEPVAP